MTDLIFVALSLLSFAVLSLLTVGFQRLMRGHEDE